MKRGLKHDWHRTRRLQTEWLITQREGLTVSSLTAGQLFQLIKSAEAKIPIPAPFVTVDVGTFDAAAGTFTGLKTQVTTDPEPVEHESGQHPTNPPGRFVGAEFEMSQIDSHWRRTITRVPAPIVPVAPVLLQFNVANTSGPWSVTIAGYTTSVPAGQSSVSVNVWDLTSMGWTLQVGNAVHEDRLMIQRKSSIPAAGGFTIPVLPVAIIYAPPVDSGKKSTATYAQGNTVGTSVTYDFSTDSSQTAEPAFTDGTAFRAFLTVVGVGLTASAAGASAAGDAAAATADTDSAKDLSTFASLLPSDAMNEQQGLATDNSSTVTVTYTSTSTIGTTAAGGGPGVGDTIVFFKDVLVAWAYEGGSLQLCPIGWTETVETAAQIQDNPAQIGIAASDQQLLLSLDPFVAGGPFVQLPEGRFTVPDGVQASIEYGGGSTWNQQYTVTRDVKELSSQKSYTTDTDTWSPGPILGMFGIGSSKSQKTTTITTANASDVSQTVTLAANLQSGPGDNFVVTIWYDSLFGTWAFQQVQPVGTPVVSGHDAAPGTVVKLESGGKVHATVADAQGRYAFHAPNITPGNAQLFVGTNPATAVVVPGGPHHIPPHKTPVLTEKEKENV